MRTALLLHLALALQLIGCASAGTPAGDDDDVVDAAQMAHIDAMPGSPDAPAGTPDARPPTIDAAVPHPDAWTPPPIDAGVPPIPDAGIPGFCSADPECGPGMCCFYFPMPPGICVPGASMLGICIPD